LYFIELLRQLRPAYAPSNIKAISERLLDTVVTNINTKINLQLVVIQTNDI
ncbi:12591_t:CDS:1, partial [Entrophospora sp. SA101]